MINLKVVSESLAHNKNSQGDAKKRRACCKRYVYVNLLQKIISWPAAIILLPLAIVVIPILNALGLNSADLDQEDVLAYLYRMKDGELDDHWWDDFLNVPIKNEALDKIREACGEVWEPHSAFLVRNEEGLFELNQVEQQRIEELIGQTKRVSNGT